MKTIRLLITISCISIFMNACRKPVESCDKVLATGKGHIVTQTASGATTVSDITGTGGLSGSTLAGLVFTGADSTSGTLFFKGDLVLKTSKGTLTFDVFNGLLNPVTGEFSNDAVLVSGTDAYYGATGNLYFHGFTYPDGSFIDDKINGEICTKARVLNFK